MDDDQKYPDISDILARKAAGRARRAALSFSDKLKILEEMRARAEPIVRARNARSNRRTGS